MAQLIVQLEGAPPVVHELTGGAITIGRETDNVIVIPDPSVSRHHAEIPASDGPRTLRDLDSANGTAVNWVSITETLLKPGDVIYFGVAQATFVIKAKVAVPAPVVPPRPPVPLPPSLPAPPVIVAPPPLPTAVVVAPPKLPPPKTVTEPPASPPQEAKVPLPPPVTEAKRPIPPPKPVEAPPPLPPAAVAKPSAVVERQLPPVAVAKEKPATPELPPMSPANAPRPAAVKSPPLAFQPPPPAEKPLSPAAKVTPSGEKTLLPVAKLPAPAVPPPPVPSKAPELAPTKTPAPTPAAVSPPAVAKTLPPAPAAPTPAPTAPVKPTLLARVKALLPAAKLPAPAPVKAPLHPVLELPAPAEIKPPLPAVAKPTPAPAAKLPPPFAVPKPAPPAPASKRWRPEAVVPKATPPKPDPTRDVPPQPAPVGGLPLVPAGLGQKLPASDLPVALAPALIGVRESPSAPDLSPSFFSRQRVLFAVLTLTLIAATAVAAWWFNPPALSREVAVAPAPKPVVATGEELRPVATKHFWDQMQEIARTGLKQAQSIPFQQYPLMSNGMYDFERIDDSGLDDLMNALTARSSGLSHIAEQIRLLDKTNVDPDLLAFGKRLADHWQRAGSLDSDAVNVVWAVHQRRARPAADAPSALDSADVVSADSRGSETATVTMDQVSTLASGWLVERNYFVQAGLEVDASEKAMYRQMAERYKDQFK